MAATRSSGDLRVLVVGLGSIGVRHLENLRRLGCGHIGALRSRNRPLHRSVDLDGVTLHRDLDEALAQGYDAVVVCNPTSLHLQYAQRAADAGCHLYIEKPVSNTLENTSDLLRTVEECGLVATVGCQLRFHPNLITIKGWLDRGAVGHVLSVRAENGEYLPGWHPWEDYRESYAARHGQGGGVVLTQIHEIDYLCWLFGPLAPVCSYGGVSSALELDVEDHITSILVSHDGVPVCLQMDYLQRPPSRSFKAVGTQGVIDWDYHRGQARLTVDGDLKETSRVPSGWERNELFLAIMRDFLESVLYATAPTVSLQDGNEALRIALEMKVQLQDKRDPGHVSTRRREHLESLA